MCFYYGPCWLILMCASIQTVTHCEPFKCATLIKSLSLVLSLCTHRTGQVFSPGLGVHSICLHVDVKQIHELWSSIQLHFTRFRFSMSHPSRHALQTHTKETWRSSLNVHAFLMFCGSSWGSCRLSNRVRVCVCVCVWRHFRNSVFVLLFKPNYKHKQKLLNDTLTATLQVQQRESSEHAWAGRWVASQPPVTEHVSGADEWRKRKQYGRGGSTW